MDYTAFQALVASYLHRSDLTSLIPTFIEHGRIRMCRDLRVAEMETWATVTLTDGVGDLSSDVAAIRYVRGPSGPLEEAEIQTVLEATTESVYCVTGLELRAPGCGTVDVYYWERPVTLVGAAGSATRTVLSVHPNVWLFAALVEAAVYLEDDAREVRLQQRLDAEIAQANAAASRVRFSRPAMSDTVANIAATGSGL